MLGARRGTSAETIKRRARRVRGEIPSRTQDSAASAPSALKTVSAASACSAPSRYERAETINELNAEHAEFAERFLRERFEDSAASAPSALKPSLRPRVGTRRGTSARRRLNAEIG